MNRRPHAIRRGVTAILSGLALSATIAAIIPSTPGIAVSFREPNRKPPRGTLGGGSRTGSEIASLVPHSGYGTTNQARPTFLVYLAPGATAERTAVFYLQDTEQAVQYEATIPLTGQSGGIVAFQLPDTFQDLAVERPYHWFLVLKKAGDCKLGAGTSFVRGTIERLPATPAASSNLTLSLDAAIAASQAGRWYDAAATLAALRQEQPDDPEIGSHWKEFLQSAQLGDFTEAPSTHISVRSQ